MTAVNRPADECELDFIVAANTFVETLRRIAKRMDGTQPRAAALLLTYANSQAGSALDLLRRWP